MECTSQATLIKFNGHPIQVIITQKLVQEALHVMGGDPFPKGNLSLIDKNLVSTMSRTTFAKLRHLELILVLQLYMDFFKIFHTQRYTIAELRMAHYFIKAYMDTHMLPID